MTQNQNSSLFSPFILVLLIGVIAFILLAAVMLVAPQQLQTRSLSPTTEGTCACQCKDKEGIIMNPLCAIPPAAGSCAKPRVTFNSSATSCAQTNGEEHEYCYDTPSGRKRKGILFDCKFSSAADMPAITMVPVASDQPQTTETSTP